MGQCHGFRVNRTRDIEVAVLHGHAQCPAFHSKRTGGHRRRRLLLNAEVFHLEEFIFI